MSLKVGGECAAGLAFLLILLGGLDLIDEGGGLDGQVGTELVELGIVRECPGHDLDRFPGAGIVTALLDLAGALDSGLDLDHVIEDFLQRGLLVGIHGGGGDEAKLVVVDLTIVLLAVEAVEVGDGLGPDISLGEDLGR